MAFSNFIINWFPGRVYKRLFYGMLIWLCVGFVFFTLHSNVKVTPRNSQQLNNNFYEYIDPGFLQPQSAAIYYNSGLNSAQSNNLALHLNAARGLMQKDYNSGLISNTFKLNRLDNSLNQFSNNSSNFNKIFVNGQLETIDSALISSLEEKAQLAQQLSLNNIKNSGLVSTSSWAITSNNLSKIDVNPDTQIPVKVFYQLSPHVGNVNTINEQQILSQLAGIAATDAKKNDVKNVNEINVDSNESPLSPFMNHNHNLPVAEWPKAKQMRAKQKSNSKKCSINYPDLYDLHFNNIFWQVLRGLAPSSQSTSNQTQNTSQAPNDNTLSPISFYLYNAYYDDRVLGGPLPQVRILAMIDRVEPPKVNCLLWYSNFTQPVITTAKYTYAWYSKWGNFHDGQLQPFIISCTLPKVKTKFGSLKAPDSVTLTLDQCAKPMNNLRVINEKPKEKKKFAVCVKGLDFLHEDLSVRLVEWIELLNILGAEKIFLYDLEVHPNISKVIQYYVKKGFVELTKLTLPGEQPNIPGFRHLYLKNKLTNKRQNELIPYNDCLYRNLYSYKYLALLDIDEIIMPLKFENWSDLMDEVEKTAIKNRKQNKASYNVRNAYFLDDLTKLGSEGKESSNKKNEEAGVPSYMHMLSHVVRSRNYTKPGQYVKCFHDTERVVSLHNHFPLNCFGTCSSYSIDTSLAHLQHYRKDCVGPLHNACNKDFRAHTVRDTTIWRYKEPLINRVTQALFNLGFFSLP